MSKYKIKDLAVEVSQRLENPQKSRYDKFVGLEHYNSGEVMITRYGKTDNLNSSVKIFKKGDILIARRNVYLKRAGLVNFDGVTSGDSIVLRAHNDTIRRLLPFVFNTKEFWDYANQFADGSMSKRLSPKLLLEYEAELPDSDEEKNKLANLLWSIFETMCSYKELLVLSDELIKSQFIEMFDECKSCKLKELAYISSGQSSPKETEFTNVGIPFIKAGNLEGLKLAEYEEKDCNLVNDFIINKYKLKLHKAGTILVAKSGMSCLSGHVYALKNDAYVVSHLACIEPKNILFSNFLKGFFLVNGTKSIIQDPSYPSIQLGAFENMDIPFDDGKKIIDYCNFINQIDRVKFILREDISNLEIIYKRIMVNFLKKED